MFCCGNNVTFCANCKYLLQSNFAAIKTVARISESSARISPLCILVCYTLTDCNRYSYASVTEMASSSSSSTPLTPESTASKVDPVSYAAIGPLINLSKSPLTQWILNYILSPNPVRLQQTDVIQSLQTLKESARFQMFKEVTTMLYANIATPTPAIDWSSAIWIKSKLVEIATTELVLNQDNNYSGSIPITFSEIDRWQYCPDVPSLEVGNGFFILGGGVNSIISTSKKEKRDVSIQVIQYDSTPLPRLMLLPFSDITGQVIIVPQLISVIPQSQIALQTVQGSFENETPCIPSMTHGTFKGTNFYRGQNCTEYPHQDADLRALYNHKNLAKIVARQTKLLSNATPFYLFETSHVTLREWLRDPWPLVETNIKQNDPIELSKIHILAQLAEALEYIITTNNLIHGCLCLDAAFIDSNYNAKLLWNCSLEPVPPTQEDVMLNPSAVRSIPLAI